MAVDAQALQSLTMPAIEAPNSGASFSDILKGLITSAGQAYINKEIAPEYTRPKNTANYVDTAVGEQYANQTQQTQQFFSTPAGAITLAVGLSLLGFLIYKAVD